MRLKLLITAQLNWWLYIDSQMGRMREKQNLPELDIDMEFYAIEVISNKEYIFALYSPIDVRKGDKTLSNLCKISAANFGIKLYCNDIPDPG